ncbi:MAG: flagellar basal body rod protein FlgC [bacterium]
MKELMSGLLDAIQMSSQGMTTQRRRMNTVAENIANAETTSTPKGGPYQRQRVEVEGGRQQISFSKLLDNAGMQLTRTSPGHLGSGRGTATGHEDRTVVNSRITTDSEQQYRLVYEPSHPDADEEGYVKMPDIEIMTEMVDMMSAARAYEANTVAISTAKQMAKNALDI